MKKPSEMTFAEFASQANPKGTANRLPEMNRGLPVYSYTVFMNGPSTAELPEKAKKTDYTDVMVTALTRQLGLDPKSFRDNLKVCELTAARSAWLECVCVDHQRNQLWGMEDLSGDVLRDYEQLTKGMVHPFIQTELEAQKRASRGLPPLLEEASKKMGVLVSDLAPEEVSVGRVVSQNDAFTVQQTKNGEIVTHDNRRLEVKPKLDADVAITYYKGSGQVVDTLENVKVSAPFIDKASGDLAIGLTDSRGREQRVLFNSLTGFDKFVKEHGLAPALVGQAVEARAATPKVIPPAAKRDVVAVYMEVESGCLAIDYTEDGVKYSALFGDAKAMVVCAAEFGVSSSQIATARALEVSGRVVGPAEAETAMAELLAKVNALPNVQKIDAPNNGRPYTGKVVAESSLHVAQHVGGGNIVVHDLRNLDKVPEDGEMFKVKYTNGRGKVDLARGNEGLQR